MVRTGYGGGHALRKRQLPESVLAPSPPPPPAPAELPEFTCEFTYQHARAIGAARAVVTFHGDLPFPLDSLPRRLSETLKGSGLELAPSFIEQATQASPTLVLNLSHLHLQWDGDRHRTLRQRLGCYREHGEVVASHPSERFRIADWDTAADDMRAAEGPPGKRRAAARRNLTKVGRLEFDQYATTALLVLMCWNRQKDAWAKNSIELERRYDTARRRVVVIDPSRFRSWVDPRGTNKDWRQRLGAHLKLLMNLERRDGPQWIAFLSSYVDGLTPGRGREEVRRRPRRGGSLSTILTNAGIGRTNHFFVELSPDAEKELPAVVYDEYAKALAWNHDAFHIVSKSREMPERPTIRRDITRRSSFFVVPESLIAAMARSALPASARALMVAVLAEVRDPKGGFLPCFGQTKNGYKVETWVEKAGLQRKRGRKRLQELGQLADAIEALNSWCGLEAALGTAARNTAAAVDQLRTLSNRERVPSGRNLRLYLPEDFMDRLELPMAAAGRAEVRLADGEALRQHRVALGWTQAELATSLGCDRSAVSHWERGKYQVPFEVLERVARERELRSSAAV